MAGSPLRNARGGVYRIAADRVFEVERKLRDRLVGPGDRVLDVGCGATGRSTLILAERTPDVWSIDINLDALREFADKPGPGGTRARLVCADMRQLPFTCNRFDLVLIALCGLDYVAPGRGRIQALREAERLLRSGGRLVFASLNKLGVLTSPRGLRSAAYWRWRISNAAAGSLLRDRIEDLQGTLLSQTLPKKVVAEVTRNTGLRFHGALDRSGRFKSLFLLTLFCAWPYYVFAKPEPQTSAAPVPEPGV